MKVLVVDSVVAVAAAVAVAVAVLAVAVVASAVATEVTSSHPVPALTLRHLAKVDRLLSFKATRRSSTKA